MPLIALFEVATLALNKSVPKVEFSKVLRARSNKGHSCLQTRHWLTTLSTFRAHCKLEKSALEVLRGRS